jgi:hypothetical protein
MFQLALLLHHFDKTLWPKCHIQWLYLAAHGCKTYLNLNLTDVPTGWTVHSGRNRHGSYTLAQHGCWHSHYHGMKCMARMQVCNYASAFSPCDGSLGGTLIGAPYLSWLMQRLGMSGLCRGGRSFRRTSGCSCRVGALIWPAGASTWVLAVKLGCSELNTPISEPPRRLPTTTAPTLSSANANCTNCTNCTTVATLTHGDCCP